MILDTKFHENRFSRSRVISCVQTDGQTDRFEETLFRNVDCERAENVI
jgi:hypothetical protein